MSIASKGPTALSSLAFSLKSSFDFSGDDQTSSLARSAAILSIASFFLATSKITSERLDLGPQGNKLFLQFRLDNHDYLQIRMLREITIDSTMQRYEKRSPYFV